LSKCRNKSNKIPYLCRLLETKNKFFVIPEFQENQIQNSKNINILEQKGNTRDESK
jgi:hypothetical protein